MSHSGSVFGKFTNQYSLSKTLRFELKTVGETQRLLEENNIFEEDRVRRDKYIKTKKYFDELHRSFVQESLENFSFSDLSEYENALTNFLSDKKDKAFQKELDAQEKKLRKEIVLELQKTAEIWAEKYGTKKQNLDFLEEEGIFEKVLLPLYGKNTDGSFIEGTTETLKMVDKKTGEVTEKEISIFEGWKNFTGYFEKFFATRKNFYDSGDKSTAIAYRIVNENLRKCFENKWLLEKYPTEFLETLGKGKQELLQNTEDFGNFVLQGEKGDEKIGYLGTGIDGYNFLVGQIKKDINFFRQKNKVKIPHLKTLDKQILSPKEKFIEEIEDETGLKTELENLLATGNKSVDILQKLFLEFVKQNENFELDKIYWTKKGFETISRKYSTDIERWEESLAETLRKNGEKMTKQKDKGYKFPDFIRVKYLKESLETIAENFSGEEVFWKEKYAQKNTTQENIWQQFLQIFWQEFAELLEIEKNGEQEGYNLFAKNLENELQKEKIEKKEITPTIKLFADNLLWVYQFSKYFSLEYKNRWNTENIETDDHFYEEYKNFFEDSYENIVQPYNRLRNYLTKKPWEEVKKWKLNFSNPTLAKGWDKNKETDNTSVIFRKGVKYFLGVMKKSGGSNQMFSDKNREKFKGIGYEKMVYKQMADPKRDFPKGVFSKKGLSIYKPSDEILDIYEKKDFKTESENFSKGDLWKLIDFFKECIPNHPSWSLYDFEFSSTNKYNNLNDFYTEVSKNAYKIWWENISEEYINEKNKLGELYLFQIKNKDWNEGASGTKNLHTLYFENLFSEENIKLNFPLKMNGEAELFHRPKSIEAEEEERNFKRKIIAKKRYTEDKSFFHLPISFNRSASSPNPFQFNQKVNEFLAQNPDVKILGIDRGEKHLAYYSLIDQQGNIIESDSLNIVGNKDYHYELEKRAKDRENQRKDWKAVEGIKDLKKGYISLVVHKLAQLAIEHNAIIVFEDLNMRFKQIRGGIEKSAYQQLEKALLDKLSFCVDKSKNPDEVGGVLQAHQLTAPFESFQKMTKQTGVIFYTTASYTSKIDPVSGWRPHLYLKYTSIKKSAELLQEKFDEIIWNAEKNRFEFVYTYGKRQWRVCSNVERWRGFRSEKSNNQWDYQKFPIEGEGSITEKLLELFKVENISLEKNILDQVCSSDSKNVLEGVIKYFRLICQIRNTDGDLHKKIAKSKDDEKYAEISEQQKFDEDFILSPVEPFFDSRKPEQFGKNLPKNGDDNGAYNIARKGQILLKRISEWGKLNEEEKQKKNPELFVSNDEWDEFVQND